MASHGCASGFLFFLQTTICVFGLLEMEDFVLCWLMNIELNNSAVSLAQLGTMAKLPGLRVVDLSGEEEWSEVEE